MQEAQPSCDELEGRKRTLTQKGFEYQLPFKKKIYEDALTKLRKYVDTVDMLWIDASDIPYFPVYKSTFHAYKISPKI